MKRILYLLLLVAVPASAQSFFPMKKGAVLEYKYYDDKEKPLRDQWRNERWIRFTVDEVWGDSVANVTVENEAMARLAKNVLVQQAIADISYGDVRVTDRGVEFDNMQWLFTGIPAMFTSMPGEMPEEALENITPYRAELTAAHFLPANMAVGDLLPDERYELLFIEQVTEELKEKREEQFSEAESEMMMHGETASLPRQINFSSKAVISNRKVEAFEKATTPAGTFDCWKISYEVVGPTESVVGIPEQFNIQNTPTIFKYVDYISPEVGLVKREKMNYRGNKAEETMLLVSVK